ncbi:hypothetical protein BDN70DRAFT_871644 [Pholiota conissans]|uniref:Uncharacterized protein n=1 Tax=Pholiota conissans TaxID=109636 RepID=A0A9P5ZEJ5_9AGAR|nr:hypothetical protein BDN70DRAFT_871644 [Pholiota conissans]
MAFSVFLPEHPSNERTMPPRIPLASYRHAGPSGPWPWADIVEESYETNLFLPGSNTEPKTQADDSSDSWRRYPTQLFPNWQSPRLLRSGMKKLIDKRKEKGDPDCVVYYIEIDKGGRFTKPGQYTVDEDSPTEFWETIKQERTRPNHVKVLFVENLSGTALQMLGTMYKIEPFFFSSSLNWIPSRYQEGMQQNQGDHITITLTFLRAMPNPMTAPNTPSTGAQFFTQMLSRVGTATIDPQAPVVLRSNDRILLLDLLAFHMVRDKNGSTIISYHPTQEWKSTSAIYLRTRVGHAGTSVYWQSLLQRSDDPTMILLCMLWYAMYAWDEALENLYVHICWLESRVLVANDIHLTRELHSIRASLLHYASLLQSFRKAVLFVRTTPNPAMQEHPDLEESAKIMDRECDTLISEIDRLEMFRGMQEMRIENMINLAFASVNFEDSRHTQALSEASLRDGTAMKQISYMTMVFLPASFVATLFGMNVTIVEDGAHASMGQYLAVAVPLTAVTIWIMVGLRWQGESQETQKPFLYQLKWPIHYSQKLAKRMVRRVKNKDSMNEGVV